MGQNFAMNEMKLAIAKLVHRFKIEVDPTKVPEWTCRVQLRPADGIYLKFSPR